jgi:hypothetical protein
MFASRTALTFFVTHRPIVRERPQITCGQQFRGGVVSVVRCYAIRDTRGQQYRSVVLCAMGPPRDSISSPVVSQEPVVDEN